jgi:hypothetical protein
MRGSRPGGETFWWMRRIKDAEREHRCVQISLDRLIHAARIDSQVIVGEVEFLDLLVARDALEGTYIVRLFSEFETALREYLRFRGLRLPASTEALINKVRDLKNIGSRIAAAAHTVREYRNALVHHRLTTVAPLTVVAVRSTLCRYLSWLQHEW